MERPYKFTNAVKGDVLREIEAGGNLESADDAAGLPKRTLAFWLSEAEKIEAEVVAGIFDPNTLDDIVKAELYDFLMAYRKALAKYRRGIRAIAHSLIEPADGSKPDSKMVMFLLQNTGLYDNTKKEGKTKTTIKIGGIQINRLPPPVVERIALPTVKVERYEEES